MDKRNFNKMRNQINQQKYMMLMIEVPQANRFDVIQVNKSALLAEIKEAVAKHTTTNYKEAQAVVAMEAPILSGEKFYVHKATLDLETEFLKHLQSRPEMLFKLTLVSEIEKSDDTK